MTGRCCGCGEFSSPSPRNAVLRRLESSGSSGIKHCRSDSDTYTPIESGRRRRLSKAWFDDAYIVEHCGSVETIHEEQSHRHHTVTKDITHGKQYSIDQALRHLRSTRRAMEEGIEEMRCQIYQIKFCNSQFKQKRRERHRYLDTISPTTFEQSIGDQRRSECIASARDTIYESSKSGTEHGMDDSASSNRNCASDEATDAVSVTPVPSDMDSVSRHRPSINNNRNNNCEISHAPVSPSVKHPTRNHSKSITECRPDMTGSMDQTVETTERTPSPRTVIPPKGLKTDVVLNLQSRSVTPRKKEQSKKGSGLNKLVDMLARARRGRRLTQSLPFTQSASPRLQSNRKAKTQRRWHRRISGVHRHDPLSTICKFTDKYPIDASQWGRMQCFSPVYKGSQVMLDAEGTVAASRGEEASFVLCAEAVSSGVACFDLDCQYLSDWCFVGVVSKAAVLRHGGPISESQMSYGWSNREERFKNGVATAISNMHRFTTGSRIQVALPSSVVWTDT